jgi:hypothetical protein
MTTLHTKKELVVSIAKEEKIEIGSAAMRCLAMLESLSRKSAARK